MVFEANFRQKLTRQEARGLEATRITSRNAQVDGYFFGMHTRYRSYDKDDERSINPLVQALSLKSSANESQKRETRRVRRFKRRWRHLEKKKNGSIVSQIANIIDNNEQGPSFGKGLVGLFDGYIYKRIEKFQIGNNFKIDRSRSFKVDTKNRSVTKLYVGTKRYVSHSDINNATGEVTSRLDSGHLAEMRLRPFGRKVTVLKLDRYSSDYITGQFTQTEIDFAERMSKLDIVVISSEGELVEANKPRRRTSAYDF